MNTYIIEYEICYLIEYSFNCTATYVTILMALNVAKMMNAKIDICNRIGLTNYHKDSCSRKY